MKIISDWSGKKLKCSKCGTEKSVKYDHEGKEYCNKCIQIVVFCLKREGKW